MLHLNRTFSNLPRKSADENGDLDDWYRYLSKEGKTWQDLLRYPVAVILGEAGSGKTTEFKNEVERLRTRGETAFFIPLNLAIDREGFNLALATGGAFRQWINAGTRGYFFLDAVDEARLRSHQDFERALQVVASELGPYLHRAQFCLSSRVGDWYLPSVRMAVEQQLLGPVVQALRDSGSEAEASVATATGEPPSDAAEVHELAVFCLDPLSETEAKRFAASLGAVPADPFWAAVEDGGYEFMAALPMDLAWMAGRWTTDQRLGNYSELIEFAIKHRLKEINPSYIQSGAALSLEQLRDGAEHLAAACVFSGRAYILVNDQVDVSNALSPSDALPGWNPLEHARLLGTAVFDEAIYGRVKFHHRILREYLAACWVWKKMQRGLPLPQAMRLFVAAPYGDPVIIRSRRSSLSWLASVDVNIREIVIRQHPELLMFEGNPEQWSTDDVCEALSAFLAKIENGFRPDWQIDASELRRVARRLPAGWLAAALVRHAGSLDATLRLLMLVMHGRAADCADEVFRLYLHAGANTRLKHMMLRTLSTIATREQRQQVLQDLLAGSLASNDLIAAALSVMSFETLAVSELAAVFAHVQGDPGHGSNSVASAIRLNILPSLSPAGAQILLSALMQALPDIRDRHIQRYPAGARLPQAWILELLPDCLRLVLAHLPSAIGMVPQACTDAILLMERYRLSGFWSAEEFHLLQATIDRLPTARQILVLAVASTHGIQQAYNRMHSSPGPIRLTKNDLGWLIECANNPEFPGQDICYPLARDMALSILNVRERQEAVRALTERVDGTNRANEIRELRLQRINGRRNNLAMLRRQRSMQEAHQRSELQQREEYRSELLSDISGIQTGANTGLLRSLLDYAWHIGAEEDPATIDFQIIAQHLGCDLATAFENGLASAWRLIDVPSPMQYHNGVIPADARIGLAGVNIAFSNGLDIQALAVQDVFRAAQLSIWWHTPAPWFAALSNYHANIIVDALTPWFEEELVSAPAEGAVLRTLDLALQSPRPIRRPMLRLAKNLLQDHRLACGQVEKKILRELRQDELVDVQLVADLALRHLTGIPVMDDIAEKAEWLAIWMASEPMAAWNWVETHIDQLGRQASVFLKVFADKLDMAPLTSLLVSSPEAVGALVRMFHFLRENQQAVDAIQEDAEESPFGHPVQRLRDNLIPQLLARTPGHESRAGLRALAATCRGTDLGRWLDQLLLEHASAEAERRSSLAPGSVTGLGEIYCRDPRTEGELFEQVMARLEDIRTGMEEGPFSDRELFPPGTLEKHLQLWLAARLRDTPLRYFIPRYTVHREEVVDANNRTDIQASSNVGNVCIEIKPVGGATEYSATKLASTLRNQIVGQYLRGQNSQHGILVIFRLDRQQRWTLPGRRGRTDFDELLEFLREEAQRIKSEHAHVKELVVFPIDCTEPE